MNGQRHVSGSSTTVPPTSRKGSGVPKLTGIFNGNAWSSETDKNENIKLELKELNNTTIEIIENDRVDSLHIHTNPILRFIENSQLCRCSKRVNFINIFKRYKNLILASY